MRRSVSRMVNAMLDWTAEIYKAIALELFALGGKIATAFFVFVLFFTRGDLRAYWAQRNPIAPRRVLSADSVQKKETPFVGLIKNSSSGDLNELETLSKSGPLAREKVSPGMRSKSGPVLRAKLLVKSSPPPSGHVAVMDSRAFERRTSGIWEDFRAFVLLAIDSVFLRLKRLVEWLLWTPITSIVLTFVFGVLTFPVALVLLLVKVVHLVVSGMLNVRKGGLEKVLAPSVERLAIREVVARDGYPFERYQVVTADGYILRLDRIPRADAVATLYLQHGVFDNSFAWVSSGTKSLAYRLHDMGFDVWLGNLRGVAAADTGARHLDENISSRKYWNFSLNEHAMYDFPAFFHKIRSVKRSEGVRKPKVTIVSHSLGAAVTLMYLVFRKRGLTKVPRGFDGTDHPRKSDTVNESVEFQSSLLHDDDVNVDDDDEKSSDCVVSALLLSPAGVHIEAPKLVYFMVPLIQTLLFFLPIYVFEASGPIFAKLLEDVRQNPTAKFIVGLCTALLLGGKVDNHPIHSIRPQNVFEGTSVQIYRHFVQIWRARQFQAFDYGSTKNLQLYGSARPLSMLDNYKYIDIPVAFCYGSGDVLIAPANVKAHFAAMRPEMATLHEFKDAGHLEFTVGLTDQIISTILDIISSMKSK